MSEMCDMILKNNPVKSSLKTSKSSSPYAPLMPGKLPKVAIEDQI